MVLRELKHGSTFMIAGSTDTKYYVVTVPPATEFMIRGKVMCVDTQYGVTHQLPEDTLVKPVKMFPFFHHVSTWVPKSGNIPDTDWACINCGAEVKQSDPEMVCSNKYCHECGRYMLPPGDYYMNRDINM